MARRRNPARLVIALSVAAVLASSSLYTSFAGGSTPGVQPSELAGQHAATSCSAAWSSNDVTGDARGEGLRFSLRDLDGNRDREGRLHGLRARPLQAGPRVMLEGKLEGDTFVAEPDSLKTKCPSKYAPDEDT